MTVQGAGAAHQTLKNFLCDPPPEPPGRNTAALQHARGRRRLARAGMHAAAGAAIRIGPREIARWKGCEGTRFFFVFSGPLVPLTRDTRGPHIGSDGLLTYYASKDAQPHT